MSWSTSACRNSPTLGSATPAGGSDLAGRAGLVALTQIFAHILDRVAQQFGHAAARALRRAVADRLEDRLVLAEPVLLDVRRPPPAQAEGDFERGVDEAGERREEAVVGGLQDRGMEVEVGADEVAFAVLEALHAAIGVGDAVDRRQRR